MDKLMLKKTKEKGKNLHSNFWKNGWSIIEALCLLFACINFTITICWYIDIKLNKITIIPQIRMYFSAIFVIVIWLRLNRAFRSDRTFGAYVAMLAECGACSLKILFLFFEFYIPLSVTCWVLFGGDKKHHGKVKVVSKLGDDYEKINNLLYQLYLLSFGGDYDYNTLQTINGLLAHIFVAIYFLLLTIITLNIYVALLSEAANRIIATANERADLEESDSCGKIERTFPRLKHDFEVYLDEKCSPLELQLSEVIPSHVLNTRRVITEASETLQVLSKSVEDIVRNQKLSKKDLINTEEKLKIFKEKYHSQNIKAIVKKISSVFESQQLPLVKLAKKTENRFTKCISSAKNVYHQAGNKMKYGLS